MNFNVFWGIMIPLIGTTLGAGCVFFMREKMRREVEKILLGFAAGVMTAASGWSLLVPSIEMSEEAGKIPWIPPLLGLMVGFVFLLIISGSMSAIR